MPRASGTGSSPLAALSLPGAHAEGLSFHRLAGKEASPCSPDAELSAGAHTGEKDFAEALMVGGLIQACPKYSRDTAQAKGNIYPHPYFPLHLANWGKRRLCLLRFPPMEIPEAVESFPERVNRSPGCLGH